MKISKITYLERYVPNMSCGTGYSEPDIFQVICDNGITKNVWIDVWYRTEDSSIAEFYSTMRTEFPNCDNLEEAFESGRFHCLKKDIPKEVKQYIEEVLLVGENYRNLQVKILDKYITSDCEL